MVKPPDNKALQREPAHRVAPPSANLTSMRGMAPAKRPGFAEGTPDVHPFIAGINQRFARPAPTPVVALPGPAYAGQPGGSVPPDYEPGFNSPPHPMASWLGAAMGRPDYAPPAVAPPAFGSPPPGRVVVAHTGFNAPLPPPPVTASTLLNHALGAPEATQELHDRAAMPAGLTTDPTANVSVNGRSYLVPHYGTAEHAIANPEAHTPEGFSAATHGLNMRQAMAIAALNQARAQTYTQTHQNSILDQLIAGEAARGHAAEAHNLALHAAGVYGPQGVLLNTNQNTYSQPVDEYGNPIEQ